MSCYESKRLLVVAAHQDDETIIAGVAMQQVLRCGGRVRVIYTTDGGAACPADSQARKELVARRNLEALAALQLAGVTEVNVRFLGHESGPGFQSPKTALRVVNELREECARFNPNRIVVGAFEGGNLEHDLTNFFTVRAAIAASFPREQIVEAAEYNRFFLREPIYDRLRRTLGIGPVWQPRFPIGDPGVVLAATERELQIKRQMLACFASQRHVRLVERFSFPERIRPMPVHDYCAGPFRAEQSWRFWVARYLAGQRAVPFGTLAMDGAAYARVFMRLADTSERALLCAT